MRKIILLTGASSGFGALAARHLAGDGHTVYAGMRETAARNRPQVLEALHHASAHRVDLRPIELDVLSEVSVNSAVQQVIEDVGRIDVIVHNAGHMTFGPAEAFLPEQLMAQYQVNVIGTQRLNRAALPHLRRQREGLLLWVGSSSTRGGTPPYLAPYFAAKAAMDAMAVSYAAELARWGIETTIVVPGAFSRCTRHFASAGAPADSAMVRAYEGGPNSGLSAHVMERLQALEPADADVADVARAITRVVATAHGKRPFRVHVDPSDDGAEVVNAVADRMRRDMFRALDLTDLLGPTLPSAP